MSRAPEIAVDDPGVDDGKSWSEIDVPLGTAAFRVFAALMSVVTPDTMCGVSFWRCVKTPIGRRSDDLAGHHRVFVERIDGTEPMVSVGDDHPSGVRVAYQ